MDTRVPDSTQSTADQAVSSTTEETKSVVVDRSKCAVDNSGSLRKDTLLPGTLCLKNRPSSFLNGQSNSVTISLKREAEDDMSSSCKRFVISSGGDDVPLELPVETPENPRTSPHPSGSAASDDSDVTIELDSYDEDDDRCNHGNLDVIPPESAGRRHMYLCTKCNRLLLNDGDKVQRVDLNGSCIHVCTPSTASHGEPPQEYYMEPDVPTLLQSRREFISNPVFPLPSSRILNSACTPPAHSIQTSTVMCYKIENDGGKVHSADVTATGKYKNGKQNRMSKASSRPKKGASKSVIMVSGTGSSAWVVNSLIWFGSSMLFRCAGSDSATSISLHIWCSPPFADSLLVSSLVNSLG